MSRSVAMNATLQEYFSEMRNDIINDNSGRSKAAAMKNSMEED